MTKRHADVVQQLYDHILSDVIARMPELHKGIMRDKNRLLSAMEERGLAFFTLDLPEFGKHFDKCLSNSLYVRPTGPHTRASKPNSEIPRLFQGLIRRVFLDSGVLVARPDPLAIRYLRQLYYAAKKLRLECTNVRTFSEVRNFFRVDNALRLPTHSWDADYLDLESHHRIAFSNVDNGARSRRQQSFPIMDEGAELPKELLILLDKTSQIVSSLLGIFNPYEWGNKHGPGAVSEKGWESKYDFPTWPKKLDAVFPLDAFAYANPSLWAADLAETNLDMRFSSSTEPFSRLMAVPKTQKSPRLIASEPICHQWCQQLVAQYLERRLLHTPLRRMIHFRDQTFNQKLAQQASARGSHWTIDLSSASDRVSCWLVERVFRGNESLLRALHATRTKWILNQIDLKSPKYYKPRKFACAGSALTFPVQSIVFAITVLASLCYQRRLECNISTLEELAGEALVFGDDLIVPTDVGHTVVGVLRYLGLEVNHNKTYKTGKFRESCGGEYFDGHDVTPTYFLTVPTRARPESIVSCVDSHNNFISKGYDRVAHLLKSTVESVMTMSLPTLTVGSGRFGWYSHFGTDLSGLKLRLNKELHRPEVRVHDLISRVPLSPDRPYSRLLQYFTEKPLPDSPWESGVRGRPKSSLRLRWVALQEFK